ncbi:MAG: ABC transporter permease, partial [Bdellovibrionales bacterium]|nr:ABC transporter permease [Bdellovibrionales bacterium]
MRFKIAFRNITRHRLRSILTIGMIASAVCSIVLFHGLTDYFLESLKEIAAETQFGNLQIAKETYWSPGKEDRKERMFNMALLDKTIKLHPEVTQVSGRLSFYGLVSNGDLSISGRAIGIDSSKEPSVVKAIKILKGEFFRPNEKEVIIGGMLAEQMGVKPGDDVTVLTNTVDGVMNALDMKVAGIFTAGIDEIDSQVIYMPLSIAQSIIDTTDVDIAVLRLSDLELAETNLDKLNQNLKSNIIDEKMSLRARTWKDLAVLYRQCEKFYLVQNRLIETILLALMF